MDEERSNYREEVRVLLRVRAIKDPKVEVTAEVDQDLIRVRVRFASPAFDTGLGAMKELRREVEHEQAL